MDVVRVTVDDWRVLVDVHTVVLGFGLLAAAWFSRSVFATWRRRHPGEVTIAIKLANIGSVTLRPTHHVVRVAHAAWAELITRKAALPFDRQHDVITEVYDSWYQLFGELRALLRTVPAEALRADKSAQLLVDTLVRAMNEGLRPHLTRWQADLRSWQEQQGSETGESPQQRQQRYPGYDDLVVDLESVSHQLAGLATQLLSLARPS